MNKNTFRGFFFICCLVWVSNNKLYGQNAVDYTPFDVNTPPHVNDVIPGNITNTLPLPAPYEPGPNVSGLSRPVNFRRKFVPRAPITNTNQVNESSSAVNVVQSTAYLDGFGNVLQTIERLKYTNGFDLVTFYDRRPSAKSYDYLPYSTTYNSHFQTNPFLAQQNFYNNLFPQEPGTALSEQVYSSDANGRYIDNYEPGKSTVGQNRGTRTVFTYNIGNEVVLWAINSNTGWPEKVTFYQPKTLSKKIVSNVDGHYVEEFSDKNGRVVCKRVLTNQNTNSFSVSYFIYDDFGRLRFTLTPKATEKLVQSNWQVTSTLLQELTDYQIYDNDGRIVEKHIAGQIGNEYLVYDRLNRVVLTQSPYLRSHNKWAFTLYDRFDRPTNTGIRASSLSRQDWQNICNGQNTTQYINSYSDLEHYLVYDSHGVYPAQLNNCELYTTTYYDNYNFTAAAQYPYTSGIFNNELVTYLNAVVPEKTSQTRGMVTGKVVKVIKSSGLNMTLPNHISTVYYYDDKGRVIETISSNIAGGNSRDITGYQYTFEGKLLKKIHDQYNFECTSKPNTKVVTRYLYAPVTESLQSVSQKIDNDGWRTIYSTANNNLGQTVQKFIGGSSVEQQHYQYNIRGQLSGINRLYAEDGTPATNVTFGESIKYDRGFTQKLYDGGISGIIWKGAGNSGRRAYGYTYDNAGRLADAAFSRYNGYGITTVGGQQMVVMSGPLWSNDWLDYTENNITYDANGNVKSLDRKGMVSAGNTFAPAYVDKLRFTHANDDISNKIFNVSDLVSVQSQLTNYDFKDGNTSANQEYVFDPNGNLIYDSNKDCGMEYSYTNLPLAIGTGIYNTTYYVYDASGKKLMEVKNNVTKFLDEISYVDGQLYLINNSDGYTKLENNNFKYYYFVKDHLGNVRNVLRAEPEPISIDYYASHELISANVENMIFDNIDNVRENNPATFDPNNTKAAQLIGTDSVKRIGTAILLKVMAGDKFSISAESFYDSTGENVSSVTATDILGSLVNTLAGGSTSLPTAEGGALTLIGNLFNTNNYINVYDPLLQASVDSSAPKAFVNYMLFDENFNVIPSESGALQADPQQGQWKTIETASDISVTHNGYLTVFLSSSYSLPVYMDNLLLMHYKGQLVEENHYYPFGLTISLANTNSIENKFLYQSKSLNKDYGLHYYDFHARQYDPQLGRFNSLDPVNQFPSGYTGMGNNPVSLVDPDGQFAIDSRIAQNYPFVAQLVQYYFPLLAQDGIINELYKFTHNYNYSKDFTKQDLMDIFTYGKGPWLNMSGDENAWQVGLNHPAYKDINQFNTKYPNDIWIRKDNFDAIQGAYDSYMKSNRGSKDLFNLGAETFDFTVKVLHETGHNLFFNAYDGNPDAKDIHIAGNDAFDRGFLLTEGLFGSKLWEMDISGVYKHSKTATRNEFMSGTWMTLPYINTMFWPSVNNFSFSTIPSVYGNGTNPAYTK